MGGVRPGSSCGYGEPMESDGHRRAERFEFRESRQTAVFVCQRVEAGAPILHVSHDGDGDWQFLCGGMHADNEADKVAVHCLECIVARDPSLNEVADLCGHWSAERADVGGAWTRYDGMEDTIRAGVEEHGWYSIGVGADGELPAFSYTIGLHRTFGHPELICLGLRTKLMHAMFASCVDMIRHGAPPPVGVPFAGVVEGFDVQLRPVRAPDSYRQHLGYAIWFHGGREFPVLQLMWPDKQGRFPGDPDADPMLATRQPLLP
jgi:hypothetical protein